MALSEIKRTLLIPDCRGFFSPGRNRKGWCVTGNLWGQSPQSSWGSFGMRRCPLACHPSTTIHPSCGCSRDLRRSAGKHGEQGKPWRTPPRIAPTCLVVRWMSVHLLKAFVLAVQNFLPDHFLLLRVHHGTDRGLVGRVHLQVPRELSSCLVLNVNTQKCDVTFTS